MPTIDMAATGRNIRDRRMRAGMTVADVTNACGVSAAAVCKWQNGRPPPPPPPPLILAAIWNCRIDDIVVVRIV